MEKLVIGDVLAQKVPDGFGLGTDICCAQQVALIGVVAAKEIRNSMGCVALDLITLRKHNCKRNPEARIRRTSSRFHHAKKVL